MARTRYGMDPESLALAGPQALAAAFRSGTEGMALGDRLASSALQREILRERERRTQEDRLLEATLGGAAPGQPGMAAAPSTSKSKKSKSSGSTAGVAPRSVTVPFGEYLRGRDVLPARLVGGIDEVNETLSEYDALRGTAGTRESGGFDSGRVQNPVSDLGITDDMAATTSPLQMAVALRRRPGEYGLSPDEVSDRIRAYEAWHAEQVGDYGRSMSDLMAAEQERVEHARAQRASVVSQGRAVAIAMREQGYEPTDADIPYLEAYMADDTEGYGTLSGERQRIQSSQESNHAARVQAQTDRMKENERQAALERRRKTLGEARWRERFAESDPRGRVTPKQEAALDDVEDVLNPSGFSFVDAALAAGKGRAISSGLNAAAVEADFARRQGEAEVVNEAANVELLKQEAPTEAAPALTNSQIEMGLRDMDRHQGVTGRTNEEYANATAIIQGSPKARARFSLEQAKGPRTKAMNMFDFLLSQGQTPQAPRPNKPAAPVMPPKPVEQDLIGKKYSSAGLRKAFKGENHGRSPTAAEYEEMKNDVIARGAEVSG